MSETTTSSPQTSSTPLDAATRAALLWALVACFGGIAFVVSYGQTRTVLALASLSLAILAVALMIWALWHRLRRQTVDAVLERLIRNDPAPLMLSDAAGTLTHVNPAARAVFSARPAQPLSAALAHHLPDPGPALERLAARVRATGRAEQDILGASQVLSLVALRCDDDAILWRLHSAIGTPVPVEPAAGAAPPGEIRADADRTAPTRPRAGDEFENLPVPILRIDRSGSITCASRRARHLLDDEDIVGRRLAQVVEGIGRPIHDWLREALDGRGLLRPEVARTSDGTRDLYLQITLDQVEVGDETHLVAVLHDATELKTLEAQFVQSQKMQAIGQLAGGVAHDFNNLLTAISGHCDLLLLRRDEADPDFADLEQINQNANRAASLVGQLLAFSRKQNLRPEFLDLRHTLADLTHLLNRLVGERVHLSFTHDPDLQLVRADKRQLEQVIMNLVVNARDAMPQGGEIRISTALESLKEPLKRDRVELPKGSYVVVTVEDEGTGIAADQLHKIFEPFFTTKKTGEGTGLGLSTAYGIVKQTGGFIFADSEPGKGSRFSLYFPAHNEVGHKPDAATDKVAPQPAHVGAGVVLLVEDEPPVRAFASRALRLRGYTVLEAENGEDALGILSDPALNVDIFVTDVIMPGLDGPGWVREALQDRPNTRVIFVSGYSEENLAEAQATIPNSVFLPKPFSLSQLTGVVHSQLN